MADGPNHQTQPWPGPSSRQPLDLHSTTRSPGEQQCDFAGPFSPGKRGRKNPNQPPILAMASRGGGARRTRPNVLVTGTPGTGKTTTCSLLADAVDLRHINIGDLVREKSLHDGWDEELECHIINEDLVLARPTAHLSQSNPNLCSILHSEQSTFIISLRFWIVVD